MKIAVCVKHAIDETELKSGSDGKPVLDGAACKMSVFDKNAVEEALRLKAAHAGEVVAFTLGSQDARKTLKEALAMGADRGVLVVADSRSLDIYRTAGLLSAAVRRAGPFDVVVCSEGSSDTYSGQVPPMMGEMLGLPYVGYASKVEISETTAKVERLLEDSVEEVEAPLPLLISVVSEINEPRYPTLIQIIQSSKKPVDEVAETQLEFDGRAHAVVEEMTMQTTSRRHVMIGGGPEEAAAKLVESLAKEGVL